MVKIAIVDYTQLAGDLYNRLLQKGYGGIKYCKEFSGLENPEELDVVLMHPGVENQDEAMKFADSHPKIRTAILTPSPDSYVRGRMPVFFYDDERITDFIEGKPIEEDI